MDQDQNNNLFDAGGQPPSQPPQEEPVISGSGARVYETPSTPPTGEVPYTPPPTPGQTPPYVPPPPVAGQPAKPNRTWLIVLIVLLVLCCCCAIGAFVFYQYLGDAFLCQLDPTFCP